MKRCGSIFHPFDLVARKAKISARDEQKSVAIVYIGQTVGYMEVPLHLAVQAATSGSELVAFVHPSGRLEEIPRKAGAA